MNNYTDVLDNIRPETSDEDFIKSVMGRNKKIKTANIRKISVISVVVIGLMALTITAGAANDWDYTTLFRSIFGNNPVVIDNMNKNVNYEVVSNTFDGLSFEVSAVYADAEALFVTVNITSEKPLFNESHETEGGCLGPLRLGDGFEGWPEFTMNTFSYHVINEYQMVAAIYFTHPVDRETFPIFGEHIPGYLENVVHYRDVITSGGYFSILFDGGVSLSNFPVTSGKAEVRFTVPAIDEKNVLQLYPDMMLYNGVLINEIRINPFCIIIRYSGDTSSLVSEFSALPVSIDTAMDIGILLKDSSIKPIVMSHDGGSNRGGWFSTENENNYTGMLLFYDQLLIIDDIAAVMFDNDIIPVS